MAHANVVWVAGKLSSLEIALSRLPPRESDGPNVIKTAWNKLDEQVSPLLEGKGEGLVNILTYNLRVCLNAFEKGLQVFGEDLSELISFHI